MSDLDVKLRPIQAGGSALLDDLERRFRDVGIEIVRAEADRHRIPDSLLFRFPDELEVSHE